MYSNIVREKKRTKQIKCVKIMEKNKKHSLWVLNVYNGIYKRSLRLRIIKQDPYCIKQSAYYDLNEPLSCIEYHL